MFFAGHSDVCMGVIATNDDELCNRMRFLQNGRYLMYTYFTNLYFCRIVQLATRALWAQSFH